MNNLIYQFLTLCLFFTSCGKSPFLDESPSKAQTSNSSRPFSGQVELETGTRDEQGQGRNTIVALDITGLWLVGPNTSGKNKMLVLIKDTEGNRVSIKHDVHAFLWMPDMGHGSVPIKVTKIDDGIYELSNIVFIMGGLWDIHFQFKENDTISQEVVWPLTL